jgi:hypothetical protein
MEIQLWKKIPVDIFINHIMPYAYKKHDTNLLNDIRNFIFDYRMIINYYFYDLNEHCLLVDLITYCTNYLFFVTNSNKTKILFMDFLDRNIIFRNMSLDKKYKFIKLQFYYHTSLNTEMKIKFLFALLTPSERARFINEFIIIYDEKIES